MREGKIRKRGFSKADIAQQCSFLRVLRLLPFLSWLFTYFRSDPLWQIASTREDGQLGRGKFSFQNIFSMSVGP